MASPGAPSLRYSNGHDGVADGVAADGQLRVGRSPLPLPFGSLRGRRSLLAVENLLAAIEAVLATPGTLQRVFIAADPQALTVGEMIEAMRAGIGRKPNVFPLPSPLLELLFRGAGPNRNV
jgi:nucleoside-diphosphate-sugar epimerase